MSRPNLPAPDKPREPGAHRSPTSHTCGRWGFVASTRRWIDGLAASLPNRHHRSRSESAFTLIELIVTVVILAIIVAIAIPSFLSQRRNGFDSQTVSDIRTLAQVETGLVAANAAPTRWQTGDDPALMDGFDGTDGVQHLVLSNTDDPTNPQWCVLGWNERGSKDSQDNPVWVASDSPTVSQQPIAEDCACAILLGLEGPGPDNPGGEIGGGVPAGVQPLFVAPMTVPPWFNQNSGPVQPAEHPQGIQLVSQAEIQIPLTEVAGHDKVRITFDMLTFEDSTLLNGWTWLGFYAFPADSSGNYQGAPYPRTDIPVFTASMLGTVQTFETTVTLNPHPGMSPYATHLRIIVPSGSQTWDSAGPGWVLKGLSVWPVEE